MLYTYNILIEALWNAHPRSAKQTILDYSWIQPLWFALHLSSVTFLTSGFMFTCIEWKIKPFQKWKLLYNKIAKNIIPFIYFFFFFFILANPYYTNFKIARHNVFCGAVIDFCYSQKEKRQPPFPCPQCSWTCLRIKEWHFEVPRIVLDGDRRGELIPVLEPMSSEWPPAHGET